MPRQFRKRHIIHKHYNQIRVFRNRVFHHETIWNRVTLTSNYQRLSDGIRWISPELADACKLVDRFDHVRMHGYAEIETILMNHFRTP